MANRSYILDNNTEEIIFDSAYEISIVQKILSSGNPKIVPSLMFENSFAIKSDYGIGLERLKEFFNKLIEDKVYEKYDFQKQSDDLLEKMESISSKAIVLEPVEIFALDESQNIITVLDELKNININDYVLQIENQLDEYKKEIDVISSYSDYTGTIFKRKNNKKINLLNDVMNNIDYYIGCVIGVEI